MKKLMALLIVFCIVMVNIAGGAFSALAANGLVSIYVAGDSTAATYPASRAPLTGWAQVLGEFLPSNIVAKNHAISGRSSKSFADNGNLDTIINQIQPGDYLVIQFGHNDQKTGDSSRYTNPDTTYKEYLKQYIDRSREKGAIPILTTSIERRGYPSLGKYPEAMRELAAAEGVTLIDLTEKTMELYASLGSEGSKSLFVFVEPGEFPYYPDGYSDNTHLRDYGAKEVSKIFLTELAKTDLPIAQYLQDLDFSDHPQNPQDPEEPEEPDSGGKLVVLEEDFDTVPADVGSALLGYNGWSYKMQSGTGNDNSSTYTLQGDPDDEENKTARLDRIFDEKAATTQNNYLTKSISQRVSEGTLSLRFRLRFENESATHFRIHLVDESSSGSVNLQFQITRSGGQIGDAKAGGKYFKFVSSGPAVLGTWYDLEIRIDMNEKNFTYFEGGRQLNATPEPMHESFLEASIDEVWFGSFREALRPGQLYIDDILVEYTPSMRLIASTPSNGEEDVDVYSGAKLFFRNNIASESLAGASILINGSDNLIESAQVDEIDKNAINVTFTEPLDFETDYNLTVSGIEDVYGQTAPGGQVNFRTRGRKTVLGVPNFYIDGDNITYTSLSGGELQCIVQGINEQAEDTNVVMIAAVLNGNELLDASAASKTLVGGAQGPSSLETTVMVPANTDNCSVRVYLWDSLRGMRPMTGGYTFDEEGLKLNDYSSGAGSALSVLAAANHSNGEISVSGAAEEDSEITVLALYPGYEIGDLTTENLSSIVEFVGQVPSTEGEYFFEYSLQGENRHDRSSHNVYVRGLEKTSFRIFDSGTLDAALSAVSSSTATQLVEMLAQENPRPISGGVLLNDVLQIDLSEYYTLEYKEDVCGAIAGKSYASFEELRTAFAAVVENQVEVERNISDLIDEINNAEWDEIQKIFKDKDEIIKPNLAGSYSKLTNSEKTTLYKRLAQYNFTDIIEVRNAFSKVANDIVNERRPDSGNNKPGGTQTVISGGKTPVPVIPPITPQPALPVFNDIGDVEWAVESINGLAELKVIDGVGNNRFAPHERVTREQFVKMLVLAFDLMDTGANTELFSDVNKNEWYYPYVASGVQKGIIQGMGDGTFGVGRFITRAEMTVLACRAAEIANKTLPKLSEAQEFVDTAEIPEYARAYVKAMQQANIMSGVGESRFAPGEGSTRAMAAKVIFGLVSLS